jgi:glyoxylase-like metal-dependent hydrolase (beta-lactamase superfamily II)
MFLTATDGVVLVDAPPTIGHNLLRAVGAVTRANGRPGTVTHQIYSHSHSDHIGASVLFGPDVVRIGHRECRTLLLRDDDPNRWPPACSTPASNSAAPSAWRCSAQSPGPSSPTASTPRPPTPPPLPRGPGSRHPVHPGRRPQRSTAMPSPLVGVGQAEVGELGQQVVVGLEAGRGDLAVA